jgi:hypothetical protein
MNKHHNILKWKQRHRGWVNSGDNVSYVHEQLSAESVHQSATKIMNWPATFDSEDYNTIWALMLTW